VEKEVGAKRLQRGNRGKVDAGLQIWGWIGAEVYFKGERTSLFCPEEWWEVRDCNVLTLLFG